jgi:D-amino-acid dehydrogenase
LVCWLWRFWRSCTAEHVEQSAPLLRDLNCASRACYEELSAELGDSFELHKTGLMMLCKTQHALDDEARVAEQAAALGMPAQLLDAGQAAALNPGARMDIRGAVYFPDDCHLAPDRFMAALQANLTGDAECQFVWNAEADGVKLDDECRIAAVQTNHGDHDADEVVLAAGSWSPLLARQLRLKLSMQAGKGYSLTLERPRQSPKIPVLLTEARIAVTPLAGRLRFGGTMEISGLNETIAPRRVRGIIKNVPRYLPEFGPQDFEGIRPWRGLRPCSPDGLPYIGRTERCDNLLIATGHAMMGLSLGPITGELIAELIAGEQPSIALDQLSPDRFS